MQHIFKGTSQLTRGYEGSDLITVEARVSYYNAFGVYPDMQRALEEKWRATTIGDLGEGSPVNEADVHYTSSPALLDQDNAR